jgi:iron complex transport system ATP-binding protein
MNNNAPVLMADSIHFAYREDAPVLRGVSVAATRGELRCLLGCNGCGKTTLLRLLLGQLPAGEGEILLEGQPVESYSARARAQKIAYVPQQPISAFAFTVGQIVQMGRFAHLGSIGVTTKQDRDIAQAAMQMTECDHLVDRPLGALSGGEAQRVMIARALAQQPTVMLLDEPTSHLDIHHQLSIHQMMQRLAHEWEMSVVCVSHDINLAGRFADQLTVLHEGQVLADGRPEEVLTAATLSTAYQVSVDFLPAPTGPPQIHARLSE